MTVKFNRIKIYVGMRDRDNRVCNSNMLPYTALFELYLRNTLPIYFDGATSYTVDGLWKGTSEPSRVIEILIDESNGSNAASVHMMACELKALFNQESVLVTTEPVHGTFI